MSFRAGPSIACPLSLKPTGWLAVPEFCSVRPKSMLFIAASFVVSAVSAIAEPRTVEHRYTGLQGINS